MTWKFYRENTFQTETDLGRAAIRDANLLGSVGPTALKPPAMTRKQIDVSIYVFIMLLIAFFGRAVWGVMGMIGWV